MVAGGREAINFLLCLSSLHTHTPVERHTEVRAYFLLARRPSSIAVGCLFMSFDGDGSGQMDLKELERLLEKPDDSVVSVASTQAKLRETLRQQASRVIDLFKSSDVDGDGEIGWE